MHGLGNDYIVLDGIRQRIHLTPALIKKLCDRHTGIGADGVILIMPVHKSTSSRAHESVVPDFRMRIFNADGSEAEMCGNGIRCLGKYIYEHGLSRKQILIIATKAGNRKLELFVRGRQVTQIRVAMGKPADVANEHLTMPDEALQVTRVDMGNPHCVVFTKHIDELPIDRFGAQIECHTKFPQRTNVEFVQVINKDNVKQRTWERGVGETLACGTGAAAVVAAGVYNKFIHRQVTVHLKGGDLLVDQALTDEVYITGPAEEVFSGTT